MEKAYNPYSLSSVLSDNSSSEYNNKIVIETDEFDDGSVKPSPPSGM